MSELRAIRIERGPQGFGGPLVIKPTEKKNKVMYITGGGTPPECLDKIVELSGMEPVDGFHGSAPEDELAMVIIDCGGTAKCLPAFVGRHSGLTADHSLSREPFLAMVLV